MRRKENRQSVDTLVIFGAGASYSATAKKTSSLAFGPKAPSSQKQAPLDTHFCKIISELAVNRPLWVQGSCDKLSRAWKDTQKFENYGLEDAILKQLGHLEFLNAIHQRRKSVATDIPTYLDHLAHLITFVLQRCREDSTEPYGTLIKHLYPRSSTAKNTKNRIITFNYDDLPDRHLLKKFEPQQVYFDKILVPDTNGRRERFHHPLLVKLHGSVNWNCSSESFQNIIGQVYQDDRIHQIENVSLADGRCPSPDDNNSPCIIPPLPSKPITRISLFNFLWTKAYEYLHEAKELVICGYSLPPTDRLAVSMFGNFSNSHLKKVTIIDPNPDVVKKWRILLDRKKVASTEWIYHTDFKEYVATLA